MSIKNPSITYLITSTGRESLKETLRSLYGQFAFGLDKVRLYFDGGSDYSLETFTEEFSMFGHDNIFVAPLHDKFGYWGHGLRNSFQSHCFTDYIHHMDDDDIYCEGAIPQVRNQLKSHYGKVIICKFRADGGRIIWKKKDIIFGEVGTPSGFIFNRPEIMGTWGLEYGGDFAFYDEVKNRIGKENLVFSDTLIVKTKPRIYGY